MPIFGKRKGNMTPEEQEAARQRRRQLLETIGATMSDVGAGMQGEQGAQLANLRQRRENAMQEAQRMAAFNDLMGQMQPDTQTPQVNELIGEANLAGRGRFDPMDQMQAKAPAFDFTSPQGQAALMKALGAGVSLDGISGLRDFLSPKRNTTKLGENDTLVDDDGNVVGQGRMKPMEPQKRSTDSVVADIAYRYSRGEQISPREMELYRLWSAQERKQGQWAPNVSGAPGPRPTGRRVTF
ncbi:MAG: hypothetical protein ING85_03840 [Phenylobacterium sp.]|uniref:hypothetical protein n=1 Tax=Phenylobacterium sp. TaxID=1871053 RepID=UPI0025DCA628|nr:hypothetical protein [Phenylobacterium sp.]MCA4915741.1 hypothetical protein [Phenylobacterium sp.]